MERIVPAGTTAGVSRPARPGARRGCAFAVAGGSGAATISAPAAPLASAAMLTLQELDCHTVQDREARRQGEAVLHALAALQRARLAGNGSTMDLQQVLAAAAATPARDPHLAAILAAVMLRARVELARAHATPQEHFTSAS